jgi:hypothetical protein
MNRLRIVGFTVACVLFSYLQAFSQDETAKPKYKNGDSWLYTVKEGGSIGSSTNLLNGTYEISVVDGKMKTAEVNGSQKEDLEPRPPVLLSLLTFAPNLDFPLTVGKQWSREYKTTYVGGTKQVARKVTYEVKGVEEVTTQAGTFRAFKLESDDRSGPAGLLDNNVLVQLGDQKHSEISFRQFCRRTTNGLQRQVELIKFTPAP